MSVQSIIIQTSDLNIEKQKIEYILHTHEKIQQYSYCKINGSWVIGLFLKSCEPLRNIQNELIKGCFGLNQKDIEINILNGDAKHMNDFILHLFSNVSNYSSNVMISNVG